MVTDSDKAQRLIEVGMGELAVARDEDVLVSYSLGSCVALLLYDPGHGIAGMAHVMVPRPGRSTPTAPAKSAPEAVTHLLRAMDREDANRRRITARLVGGASLFGGPDANGLTIGDRNVVVLKEVLAAERIPLAGEDTGGDFARTVFLAAQDGTVKVRTVARGEYTV